MKTKRIVWISVLLAAPLGARSAAAEGWSLSKLNPFAKNEEKTKAASVPRETVISSDRGYRYDTVKPEPSTWQKFDTGTKKFFAGTKDALTWKKPTPKPTKKRLAVPWLHDPKDPNDLRGPKGKKKSWFSSLFAPKEPNHPRSMKEFVGLPRPEF